MEASNVRGSFFTDCVATGKDPDQSQLVIDLSGFQCDELIGLPYSKNFKLIRKGYDIFVMILCSK